MNTKDFNNVAGAFFSALQGGRIHPALHEGCQIAASEYLSLYLELGYGDKETLINHCRGILTAKDREYATDGDKLHNFKSAVESIHDTPLAKTFEVALRPRENEDGIAFFYALKHATSVKDIVTGIRKASPEMALEKFGDVINYCCIIAVLRYERTMV